MSAGGIQFPALLPCERLCCKISVGVSMKERPHTVHQCSLLEASACAIMRKGCSCSRSSCDPCDPCLEAAWGLKYGSPITAPLPDC